MLRCLTKTNRVARIVYSSPSRLCSGRTGQVKSSSLLFQYERESADPPRSCIRQRFERLGDISNFHDRFLNAAADFFQHPLLDPTLAFNQGYAVWDKTSLIKDFITHLDSPHKVLACLRPPGFGKTSGLHLLNSYLDLGKADENKDKANIYKDFFSKTKIWNMEEGKFRGFFHSHPVISLSFSKCRASSWEVPVAMKPLFHEAIFNSLKKFEHVIPLVKSQYDKTQLERVLAKEWAVSKDELSILSTVLFEYYKKPVILLVDDYDVPLRYGLTHGFLEFISADMFQLFDATTSRADGLLKAMVCGVVGFDPSITGFGHAPFFTLLDEPFASGFGVTTKEALETFESLKIPVAIRDSLLRYGFPSPIVDVPSEAIKSKIFPMNDVINVINQKEIIQLGRPIELSALRRVFAQADTTSVKACLAQILSNEESARLFLELNIVGLKKQGIQEKAFSESEAVTLWTYLFYLGAISVYRDQFGTHAGATEPHQIRLLIDIIKPSAPEDEKERQDIDKFFNAISSLPASEVERHVQVLVDDIAQSHPEFELADIFNQLVLVLESYARDFNCVPDKIIYEDHEFRCFVPRRPVHRGVVLRRVDVILPRKEEVEKMDMKEGLAFEEAIDKILEKVGRKELEMMRRDSLDKKFLGRCSEVVELTFAFSSPSIFKVIARIIPLLVLTESDLA